MFETPISTDEVHLCSLADLEGEARAHALSRAREIFFITSARTQFSSNEQKETFFRNYTSYYVEHCPSWFYVALKNDHVVGYLSGCADSEAARPILENAIPSSALFSEWFRLYPAHLHINVDPAMHGQGLGGKLISRFMQDLKKSNVLGVHLVTAANAKNVSFYSKLGFKQLSQKTYHEAELVCLGLSLRYL